MIFLEDLKFPDTRYRLAGFAGFWHGALRTRLGENPPADTLVGKRIKIARIKADLTQERLAEIVSISPTHMSNIETGTTCVSLTAIISIANALSVTVDDILCDSVKKAVFR